MDPDEKPAPEHVREGMPVWALLLVALPALYVLSVGPVAVIFMKFELSFGPFETFYAPLTWLHEHTFFKQPLEWYVKLWGLGT